MDVLYLEPVLALIAMQHLIGIDSHYMVSAHISCVFRTQQPLTVSERVDRDQYMANVCLFVVVSTLCR